MSERVIGSLDTWVHIDRRGRRGNVHVDQPTPGGESYCGIGPVAFREIDGGLSSEWPHRACKRCLAAAHRQGIELVWQQPSTTTPEATNDDDQH